MLVVPFKLPAIPMKTSHWLNPLRHLGTEFCNKFALATSTNDLLQDEKNDHNIAERVLLQVLFHDLDEFLRLWCCHCANSQANAHDDGTHQRTPNHLGWLEEIREGLLAVWRLQAVASQLVARRRQNTCCHNGGEHAHDSSHHGARNGRVQARQED